MHRLVLLMFVWGAMSIAAEGRFRADDGPLGHLADNPALAPFAGDVFSLGYGLEPRDGHWDRGTQNLDLVSPLLSFRYGWDADSNTQLGLSTSVRIGDSLGLGYEKVEFTGHTNTTWHNGGAVYRPFDVLSLGLTVDDAFGPQRLWGGGVGVRPLALWSDRSDWLTLTADGNWSGNAVNLESVGGRVSWRGSSLRVWYEVATHAPAFEVTISAGPSEATGSWGRAETALRWSPRRAELAPFGPLVLRLRLSSPLAASASPNLPWGASSGANLPALLQLLELAEKNPDVVAVAFEDPPTVEGLASAQELRQALERLQHAGKKVYIHADAYTDSKGYQGWMSVADHLGLHPTGSVELTAGGSRRLYLKTFLEKWGVRFVNFAPWETKSANNPLTFASMPDGERSMLQRFLSDRDAQAAEAFADGRGKKLQRDAASLVNEGPWLVATQARELGLVDALESRPDFESFVTQAHPGATFVDHLTSSSSGWGPTLARRAVALVHLAGDIVQGPGQAGRSIGRDAAQAIADLRADNNIHALVLRVDSPGGAVTPSDLIAEEVEKTVAAGKPVVVIMGDLAASGGYYLSAPASRIFARPGTLTGSIGVTAAVLTAPKALDLLGVRADGVDLAPSAGFGDWTRDLSSTDTAKWNAMILATYDRFLDVVAKGRHLDKAKLEPLARGQIYTGREALSLGLVDELGGQSEAQAWLEEQLGAPIEFRDVIPGETNPWGDLLGPLAKNAVPPSASQRLLAGLEPVVAPWAEALEGVAARGPGPLVWTDER